MILAAYQHKKPRQCLQNQHFFQSLSRLLLSLLSEDLLRLPSERERDLQTCCIIQAKNYQCASPSPLTGPVPGLVSGPGPPPLPVSAPVPISAPVAPVPVSVPPVSAVSLGLAEFNLEAMYFNIGFPFGENNKKLVTVDYLTPPPLTILQLFQNWKTH